MNERLSRARVLGLLAAGGVAGLPAAGRSQQATIRIGWTPTENAAQAYYGTSQGFFTKAGLTVELFPFPNSAAISQAVVAGALDVGAADMIQVATGVSRGIPMGFFAGAAIYSSAKPTLVLCANKDSSIRKATDLEGQTVAVIALNSISSCSVEEWLTRNGADVAKVKIFEMPFPTMLPALERGTIAAALFAEPFVARAKAETRQLAATYDTVAKTLYITSWFTTRDWIQKNPDASKRLTGAIYDIARWANAHQSETAVILSQLTHVDVDLIRSMNRATFATSLDPKLMQPVLDIAAKYKVLDRRIAAAELILPLPA
jgi:NitT/TauT family transport system substrate-binding protein